MCDVSPLILEQLGKLWNVGAPTTDHRELVTRHDVDAVLVANPNAFHAEVTLDAIAATKHVLFFLNPWEEDAPRTPCSRLEHPLQWPPAIP